MKRLAVVFCFLLISGMIFPFEMDLSKMANLPPAFYLKDKNGVDKLENRNFDDFIRLSAAFSPYGEFYFDFQLAKRYIVIGATLMSFDDGTVYKKTPTYDSGHGEYSSWWVEDPNWAYGVNVGYRFPLTMHHGEGIELIPQVQYIRTFQDVVYEALNNSSVILEIPTRDLRFTLKIDADFNALNFFLDIGYGYYLEGIHASADYPGHFVIGVGCGTKIKL